MQGKEINILRKIVHGVGFIYKIIQGCTLTKHLKKCGLLSLDHVVLTDLTLVCIKKKMGQNNHVHNCACCASQKTRADPLRETYFRLWFLKL